jgi:hypothetical protein
MVVREAQEDFLDEADDNELNPLDYEEAIEPEDLERMLVASLGGPE